jgi:hypothetical protein
MKNAAVLIERIKSRMVVHMKNRKGDLRTCVGRYPRASSNRTSGQSTGNAPNFWIARHLFTMRRGAGHISQMPPTQLVKQLQ